MCHLSHSGFEDKRASGENVEEGSIGVGFLGERWEGEGEMIIL